MNDAAAGVLDPGVDRERAVEQGQVVEVELDTVAAGREIVHLADLRHRAVAVEDGGAARVDHLAAEGHVGERLVHLELELEAKGVPGDEIAPPGRSRMAGDRICDHDASLSGATTSTAPVGSGSSGRHHDGHLPGKQAVAKRPDRFTRRGDSHDLAGLEHHDAIADLAHDVC